MREGGIDWDNHIEFPPLTEPMNMNAMKQRWAAGPKTVGHLAVSECGWDSSSASDFSDSESLSSFSVICQSDAGTRPDRAGHRRPRSPPRATVHHLHDGHPPDLAVDNHNTLLWVSLHKGLITRGQRVCWMPARLMKGKRGNSEPVTDLKEVAKYKLKPETNQSWLSRGIRLEKVDIYREEFGGPGALLTVFRDHHRMAGAPHDVNHPKETRVGRVILARKA